MYRDILVCNIQDGTFLKVIKQLAHGFKMDMYASPIKSDDYKSDEKVHILPKRCFSEYFHSHCL